MVTTNLLKYQSILKFPSQLKRYEKFTSESNKQAPDEIAVYLRTFSNKEAQRGLSQ